MISRRRRAGSFRARSSATSRAAPKPTRRCARTAPCSTSSRSCRGCWWTRPARAQKTTLFGRTYDAPFGIAPMGGTAMAAYQGDLVLARAAAAANIPMIMSGASLTPLEEVRAGGPHRVVPGLPARRDGAITEARRARARAAGFDTLVAHRRRAGGGQPREQRAQRLQHAAAPHACASPGTASPAALALRHVPAHAPARTACRTSRTWARACRSSRAPASATAAGATSFPGSTSS